MDLRGKYCYDSTSSVSDPGKVFRGDISTNFKCLLLRPCERKISHSLETTRRSGGITGRLNTFSGLDSEPLLQNSHSHRMFL
jgi:hypothetical protein